MSEYVQVLEVVPPWVELGGATKDALTERGLHYPVAGAHGQTLPHLLASIERIAQEVPSARFVTLVHQEALGHTYSLLYPHQEACRITFIEFAAHRSGNFPVGFESASEVEVSTSLDVDDYVAFIEERVGIELDLDEVQLFNTFPTLDVMKDVLTLVATHLVRPCKPFVAAVMESVYGCTLEQGSVTIQPLWGSVTDETAAALLGPERLEALIEEHFPQPVREPIRIETGGDETYTAEPDAAQPETAPAERTVVLSVIPAPDELRSEQRAAFENAGIQPLAPGRVFTEVDSLASWLERTAAVLPDFRAVACMAHTERLEFHLVLMNPGALCHRIPLEPSASAGRLEPVTTGWACRETFHHDLEPEALVDALREVGADASVVNGEFVLANAFHSDDTMEAGLALLAGSLIQDVWSVLVRVGASLYTCRLGASSGVEIQPLWLWTDQEKLRHHLAELLPQPHPNTRHVGARQIDGPAEFDTSLISGSLSSRIDAAAGVLLGARHRAGGRPSPFKDHVAWNRLARALADSANQGEKRERVRRYLYECITEFDVPEQESFLLARLDDEPASVRSAAYPGMLKLGHDGLLRYVNRRYCEGETEEQETIAEVIWRNDRAIELLVRERLAPASHDEPGLARRITRLFHDEHIEVKRAWTEELSPDVKRSFAPLIRD